MQRLRDIIALAGLLFFIKFGFLLVNCCALLLLHTVFSTFPVNSTYIF